MLDTQERQRIKEQTGRTIELPKWYIREARFDDAQALMNYCQRMAEQKPNNTSLRDFLLPDTVDGYEDILSHYLMLSHSCLFVVIDADAIVGLLKINGNDNPLTAHIAELSLNVAPSHQGQRIGSTLIHRAIKWSRQQGKRRIQLDVLERNQGAIRLYERLGFSIEGFRNSAYHLRDEDSHAIEGAFTMGLVLS